jgi:anti-anti-sigma regulatory factor
MRFLIPNGQTPPKAAHAEFAHNVLDAGTLRSVADGLVLLSKESGAKALHLDVGRVDLLTAGGLSGLVALRARLLEEGVSLSLRNVKGRVYRVLALTRLSTVLGALPHEPTVPFRREPDPNRGRQAVAR